MRDANNAETTLFAVTGVPVPPGVPYLRWGARCVGGFRLPYVDVRHDVVRADFNVGRAIKADADVRHPATAVAGDSKLDEP